jgi:hypothetical protein
MTQAIEIQKYNLISLIIQLNNEKLLANIEALIQSSLAQAQPQVAEPPAYMRAVKPLRKGVTLEQLVIEADYKPVDSKTFFRKVDKIGIEEPIEDLLSMLTP